MCSSFKDIKSKPVVSTFKKKNHRKTFFPVDADQLFQINPRNIVAYCELRNIWSDVSFKILFTDKIVRFSWKFTPSGGYELSKIYFHKLIKKTAAHRSNRLFQTENKE